MSVKDYFDGIFAEAGEPSRADVQRAELIRSHIPDGVRTVLDAGCGTGIVAQALAEHYEVTGLELSDVGVQKVGKLGIKCVQGSIAEIPFPDSAFDLVISSEVLEHLDEDIFPRGLGQLARVASPYVLVTVPNREDLRHLRQECPRCRSVCVPWGHIRAFDVGDVRKLFDDFGFVPMQAHAFGPLVPDGRALLGRLLRCHRWYRNPLRQGMSCPICKYSPSGPRPGRPTLAELFARPLFTSARIFDYFADRLGPKCHRWLLGLYKRV